MIMTNKTDTNDLFNIIMNNIVRILSANRRSSILFVCKQNPPHHTTFVLYFINLIYLYSGWLLCISSCIDLKRNDIIDHHTVKSRWFVFVAHHYFQT